MQRTLQLVAFLIAGASLTAAGCRSCDSCYDYSPPVADCACNSSWTERSGSAHGGYVASTPYVEGEAAETIPTPASAR
ncbi:MAG: hypothetical protein WD669_00105 [Pirellulales bacterium]